MSRGGGSRLDVAFLGCGEAARMHSGTLDSVDPGVRLHYASRDREKAEAYREEHGGEAAYGSYAEALGAPAVDAAFVVTPPARHLELTLRALEAGKHVIVEKPPFLTSSDFDRVRRAAEEAGRRVMVAENYYYKPIRREVARVMERGWLGEVLFLRVDAVKRQEPAGWRADPELSGGGALFEGGIHWVNFMANLGFAVEEARGHRPAGGGEPGEGGPSGGSSVLLTFDYARGPVGTLYYSWEVPSPLQGARISKAYGSAGSLVFESNGAFLFLNGARKRLRLAPGLRDIAGYRPMLRDFVSALREDREPEFTLADARRDVEILEQVYRSLGEERPGGAS